MDLSELIKPGIGAVIGFVLAQAWNLAKLFYDSVVGPRLVVEQVGGNWIVLSHSTEATNGELYKEEVFGFHVRNIGSRVAKSVRCQLLRIEYREKGWPEFCDAAEHTTDLRTWTEGSTRSGEKIATLVPGASILFQVASWREDYPAVVPAIEHLPMYYEESALRRSLIALRSSPSTKKEGMPKKS